MDIEIVKNLFFQRVNYRKKKYFDSYSKTCSDITEHYLGKYSELSDSLKSLRMFSVEELYKITSQIEEKDLKYVLEINSQVNSFEIYIIAFLLAFKGFNVKAIDCFKRSYCLLGNDICSEINKIFIQLQIAQLYEREKQYKISFSYLFAVYKKIQLTELMQYSNNFFASCCVSMGRLCYHCFSKKELAGGLFFRSIMVRLKYKEKYDTLILNNYLSIAYRYLSITYYSDTENQYIFLREAYRIRGELLSITSDNFSKEEFVYASFDFVQFCIKNNMKKQLIDGVVRKIYRCIVSMNEESKIKLSSFILKGSVELSKYYYCMWYLDAFFKWYAVAKYFKSKYSLVDEIHFLDSELVFKEMRNI